METQELVVVTTVLPVVTQTHSLAVLEARVVLVTAQRPEAAEAVGVVLHLFGETQATAVMEITLQALVDLMVLTLLDLVLVVAEVPLLRTPTSLL